LELGHDCLRLGPLGGPGKGQTCSQATEQPERNSPLDTLAFAVAYIGMGENDRALVELEQAYRQRSNSLTGLKVDPIYDPLRGEPRFQQLVRRIGLAQ
jgi:hypothetical protein